MKTKYALILLATVTILAMITFSCSSENDVKKEVPEYFDIKVEIDGVHSVPNIYIAISSSIEKMWEPAQLPFDAEYRYYTNSNDISNTSCKCITISATAYVSSVNEMKYFKFYVNQKLIETATKSLGTYPDGTIRPVRIEYVYNP